MKINTACGAFGLFASLVFLSACSSSPTAPSAELAVSQSTVSLARIQTLQVSATLTMAGTSSDVTPLAIWQSSNEQVATVAAGLISATGPGTAAVTVEHGGTSQTIAVTVRRRVYLKGRVLVADKQSKQAIDALQVFVGPDKVGSAGTSSASVSLGAPFGTSTYRLTLDPGPQTFILKIFTPNTDGRSSYPFAISFIEPATLVDFDTQEQVGTVDLSERQGTFGEDPILTWAFTVDAYAS